MRCGVITRMQAVSDGKSLSAMVAVTICLMGYVADAATLDRDEAKKSFEYLNKIRANPDAFSKEIGVDLREVARRETLKWNSTLAKVAESKALDMAKRNYLSHTTPEGLGINHLINEAGYKLPERMLKEKNANSFESISGGRNTGKEVIQGLIVDQSTPSLGHRKHLLGMTEFFAGCTDIGIGFARTTSARHKTYICIIIAKQN